MVKAHERFGKELWFAGGAWSWIGFAPTNRFTLKTMKPAMDVCRERGVDNIFFTLWGDNGKECSYFTLLPSLYYLKRYYDGVTDRKQIAEEFGILKSGGSDFHGDNKPDIAMGTGRGNLAVPTEYLQKLQQRRAL